MSIHALAQLPIGTESRDSSKNTSQSLQHNEVGKKFEALLLQQLVKIMRQTALQDSDKDNINAGYLEMFDQSVAESLAEGIDLGLSKSVLGSFDEEDSGGETVASLVGTRHATVRGLAAYHASSPPYSGAPLGGVAGRLQYAASGMLQDPKRWALEGQLSQGDISAGSSLNGAAHATPYGFQGHYKCNLFAFEMAKRGGFQVPITKRTDGWGYPTSNKLVDYIQSNGKTKGEWGQVVSQADSQELIRRSNDGQNAFLLAGNAALEGRSGHMAIIERIHHIEKNKSGQITRIVFDGWEARKHGAEHLRNRIWNLYGHPVDSNLSRGGFKQIELVALKPAQSRGQSEVPLSGH